ncbi:MAG: hypothetical protein HQ481_10265 [Alphaproteobacteria bacterium]|nr:hypothetical protein [Alphaproteobacteria bacterium]
MSDHESWVPDHHVSTTPVVEAVPFAQMRGPADLCGRAAGPVEHDPANQNQPVGDVLADESVLFEQLPAVIRGAVDEWAAHLRAKPWHWRREVMTRFASVFADQFRQNIPTLDDDAYEELKDIGFTCLLERLDDGAAIHDLHQARLYLDSVHDRHQAAARLFLNARGPRVLGHA